MRKLVKKIPIFIFIALHFSFLLAVIIKNWGNLISISILSVIVAFLSVFYFKRFNPDKSSIKKIDIFLILFAVIGAIAAYALKIELKMSAVLAAGIVGFASSLLPFINRNSDVLRELPVAIYCGAFAGMTAPFIANGYSFIISAGFISGLILIFSKDTLHGHGGKLGTIAFGGVSTVSLILFLFS